MANSATTTTAHTEAPGGHAKGPFPPFDPAVFAPQLIWLALVFGALYLLMSRIALPRIENILEARRARIAADVDEAAAMQAKAQAAGASYEKTLADAKAQAQASAQATRDKLAADSAAKRKTLAEDINRQFAKECWILPTSWTIWGNASCGSAPRRFRSSPTSGSRRRSPPRSSASRGSARGRSS